MDHSSNAIWHTPLCFCDVFYIVPVVRFPEKHLFATESFTSSKLWCYIAAKWRSSRIQFSCSVSSHTSFLIYLIMTGQCFSFLIMHHSILASCIFYVVLFLSLYKFSFIQYLLAGYPLDQRNIWETNPNFKWMYHLHSPQHSGFDLNFKKIKI